MTEAEMLARLKSRTCAMALNGHRVGHLIETTSGPPGIFTPPGKSPTSAIRLRKGRTERKTLFTLCHELGHFWSYATGRRTAEYERALWRQGAWESSLASRISNALLSLGIQKTHAAPPEEYARVLADAEREKPNPLEEGARREILAEEQRAWCFGLVIAKSLGVEPAAFAAEANSALSWYYPRLKLPVVAWTPAGCSYSVTPQDQLFIAGLTALDENTHI